jgi:hypothetical protein
MSNNGGTMNYADSPAGIAGIEGRENVGAVLTIGRKPDNGRGFPIEKDRLHIVNPIENAQKVRTHHPAFRAFNNADPKWRQSVNGQIVHATEAGCFQYSLRNQQAPGQPVHPQQIPYCLGNGERARRWTGSEFIDIPCPGDKCEFRQKTAQGKPSCSPSMRFLFRPIWPETSTMPSPLFKFTSNGWNSVRNFVGLFKQIADAAAAMGFDDYSLAGLNITLTLTEQTNRALKSRFPVMHVVATDHPVDFFARQLEMRRLMAERTRVKVLESPAMVQITGPEEASTAAADYRQNVPPTIDGTFDVEDDR